MPARRLSFTCLVSSLALSLGAAACAQPPATPPPTPPGRAADPAANADRNRMIASLNELAASETAARRARIAAIHTPAEARARQAEVRATMLRLLGPLPARTPLNAKVLGESHIDGVRIQKILFESQPRFFVTALLYLPDASAAGRLPAIVMAPGHGATGKASDFPMAALFARNGFAVLSYDPIGQGERLQYPDPADPAKSLATRPTGEHAEASLQPILLGETLGRYMLWDGMRAVDYLQSRPEIDPERIGAFGCSGGGAMTALLGALDTRIAATGTACYITSFDALLRSIGPQDGEQSTPGWLAAGLDFADWMEVAAPRPYAVISTSSDMFPYAGARQSVAEARHFYAVLAGGTAGADDRGFAPEGLDQLPVPSTPTLDPDRSSPAAETSLFRWIVGPGGHGNLRPLQTDILRFFLRNLANKTNDPVLPPATSGREAPPAGALQVTATGQVTTAFSNPATIHSLTLHEAASLTAHKRMADPLRPAERLRELLGSIARPGGPGPDIVQPTDAPRSDPDPEHILHHLLVQLSPGVQVPVDFYHPVPPGRHPVRIVLLEGDSAPCAQPLCRDREPEFREKARAGEATLVMALRPSPVGSEDQKTPMLGSYYMLGLRAQLVGRTFPGIRVDDVIRLVDFAVSGNSVDPKRVSAEASGHAALVLLFAATLDSRIVNATLRNLPPTFAERLREPLPKDLPEDLVPGIALRFDIPDLIRGLGARANVMSAQTH